MKKIDAVFNYLDDHPVKGISQIEAIAMFSDYRLSGTIFDIRKGGTTIRTSRKVDAVGKKYTRYHMV